jgi:hypothetical protein
LNLMKQRLSRFGDMVGGHSSEGFLFLTVNTGREIFQCRAASLTATIAAAAHMVIAVPLISGEEKITKSAPPRREAVAWISLLLFDYIRIDHEHLFAVHEVGPLCYEFLEPGLGHVIFLVFFVSTC